MAKTFKETSDKIFGGSSVPAGTYLIAGAVIEEKDLNIVGQPATKYDSLELKFKTDQGVELEQTMSLNGCNRSRRGDDGNAYKASGSFFDTLLASNGGKSFTVTKQFINTNMIGRKVSVTWTLYPSTSGGFGQVPVVNFVN
jgi:hypothetical protein